MSMDDNDGQMIFGDLGALSFPTFVLQVRKNTEKNLTQETYPDRGSNPGPLRDKRACYHLLHSGGLHNITNQYEFKKNLFRVENLQHETQCFTSLPKEVILTIFTL